MGVSLSNHRLFLDCVNWDTTQGPALTFQPVSCSLGRCCLIIDSFLAGNCVEGRKRVSSRFMLKQVDG